MHIYIQANNCGLQHWVIHKLSKGRGVKAILSKERTISQVWKLFIYFLFFSNTDFYFRENSLNFLYKELLKSLCFQLHSYTPVHRSNIFQTESSWWRASTASVVVIHEMILNRNMVGSVRGLSSVTPHSLKVLTNAIYIFRWCEILGHLWLY